MRTYWRTILLIFLLCIPVVIASFRLFDARFYTSQDGPGHLIRMIEFDTSLKDGQFPVRLAGRINFGLGYPFFNFNYPFVYYLGEGIHLLGFSFLWSFKILLIISVILSVCSMYLLVVPYYGPYIAYIAATFFVIAPYKFLNMYVRGNIAESLGLAFTCFSLMIADRFIKGKTSFVYVGISFALLLLTHNISAMIGIPFVIAYVIFSVIVLKKSVRILRNVFFACLIALGISAFFWIPVVIETSQTKLSELSTDYLGFFPTIKEIIYSPWGFGSFVQGISPGKMSPQIGIAHTVVFIGALLSLLYVFLKKPAKRQIYFGLFFIAIVCISIFLSLSYSQIVWDRIIFLSFVQIPWRFIGMVILCISVLTGFMLIQIRHTGVRYGIGIFLLVLLYYSNRNHIRVNQYIVFENPFETAQIYGPSTTSKDEHMPKSAPHIYSAPIADGELFPNVGISKRTVWKSNNHIFILESTASAQFRDNTSYFPGWVAFIDGKETKILYENDPLYRLRIEVPTGNHTVQFLFTEPWYRKIGNGISVVSIGLVLVYAIRTLLHKKKVLTILYRLNEKAHDSDNHRKIPELSGAPERRKSKK